MGFCAALISSLLASSYYLILYLKPSLLSYNEQTAGVLIAFFCLHISLRRAFTNHTAHVFTLFLCVFLFTLYRSFNDGVPFLIALMVTHSLLCILVLLTVPVRTEENVHAQNDAVDSNEDENA